MICTAAGAVFSSALKARCSQLRGVLSMLTDMSAKIRYRAVPLGELIGEMTETSTYADCVFLQRVRSEVERGVTVSGAWVQAAGSAPFLADKDREILADVGAHLGDSDTEGQLSMLSLAEGMLERSLQEAEADCTKRAKALLSVWTLCGIGAGIVIL